MSEIDVAAFKTAYSGVPHWWLSFADGDFPKGHQFLGGAIVPGHDMTEAVMASHALAINPGGEVLGLPIDAQRLRRVPQCYLYRLLTRDECAAMDREMLS